jgi:hypothetical protein
MKFVLLFAYVALSVFAVSSKTSSHEYDDSEDNLGFNGLERKIVSGVEAKMEMEERSKRQIKIECRGPLEVLK